MRVVLLFPFQVGPADLAENKPVTTSTGQESCVQLFDSLLMSVCSYYSVLGRDEDMIFMHVDNPGGAVHAF